MFKIIEEKPGTKSIKQQPKHKIMDVQKLNFDINISPKHMRTKSTYSPSNTSQLKFAQVTHAPKIENRFTRGVNRVDSDLKVGAACLYDPISPKQNKLQPYYQTQMSDRQVFVRRPKLMQSEMKSPSAVTITPEIAQKASDLETIYIQPMARIPTKTKLNTHSSKKLSLPAVDHKEYVNEESEDVLLCVSYP